MIAGHLLATGTKSGISHLGQPGGTHLSWRRVREQTLIVHRFLTNISGVCVKLSDRLTASPPG